MKATPVILIFDIGKTNKKLLLFDEAYNMVHESIEQFQEIKDEDGFEGENVIKLKEWMLSSFAEIMQNTAFEIKAVNFSGYGASFVLLDDNNKEITPLYNYLKPFDKKLQDNFDRANKKIDDTENQKMITSNLRVDNFNYDEKTLPDYSEWVSKCDHWKNKWMYEMPTDLSDENGINPYLALKKFNEI
jgi:sugar (pentulose or hexulose) kinase